MFFWNSLALSMIQWKLAIWSLVPLPKFMPIASVMPSSLLILWLPLCLLPSIFPSIRVFSNESALRIMWPNIGASASALILLMNIQNWFPLGFTGLVSFPVKGLSRVFSSITIQRHQFFSAQSSLWSNTHICTWLLEKSWLWLYWTFVEKVMSLLFNMLSLSYCSFQRASIF